MMDSMAGDHTFVSAAAMDAEGAWLRRLAAALVRDGADAEDAVQETWLSVLARPPRAPGPIGGWLRVVLRNVVRKRARGEARRQAREHAAATVHTETPSAEELSLRLEAQRVVASQVAALDEPYRSTVILCYYEGLPPGEVARRLNIPAGTVRWRLSHALARLRAELDAKYTTARPWRALFIPLASSAGSGALRLPGKVIKASSGAGVLKGGIVASGAILALIAGGMVLRERTTPASDLAGHERPDPSGPKDRTGAPASDSPAGGTSVRGEARRVRVPRFRGPPGGTSPGSRSLPSRSALPPAFRPDAGAGKAPQDVAAIKQAISDRMQEASERIKVCMRRWETLDPSLAGGVKLSIEVDEMGLEDVWIEDRMEVPSGSLQCLSEAVYQTDWSGITTRRLRTSFTVRFHRTR
jgi:RNA polymerase sigma-70 factor (ECF subfamily)